MYAGDEHMASTFDVTVANMLPAALTKLRFIVVCVHIRRAYVYRCMYACMCVCVFICICIMHVSGSRAD